MTADESGLIDKRSIDGQIITYTLARPGAGLLGLEISAATRFQDSHIMREPGDINDHAVRFSDGTTLEFKQSVDSAFRYLPPVRPIGKDAPEMPDPFQQAFAELGIRESQLIAITTQPTDAERRSFTTDPRNDDIVLVPGAPERGTEQVVLYQDELGGLSWHFPDGSFGDDRSYDWRAGAPTPLFKIPGRSVDLNELSEPQSDRGVIAAAGRKVFRVLAVPIFAELLRNPVESIVRRVESRYRKTLIRRVDPNNYKSPLAEPFSDWKSIAGQENRALLVLHGIFSSTDGTLSQVKESEMKTLCDAYGGRVIAFDHPTVSESPEDNAKHFLSLLSQCPGMTFEFDLLCHSRGGIVARTLIERGNELLPGHPCRFRKAYFIATPNRGTTIADPTHMLEMVDYFTNLIVKFPDGLAVYSLEIFLSLVKLLAYTGVKSLPGIAAMAPNGYISELNSRLPACTTQYAAASAEYSPEALTGGRFFSQIMKRVFADGAQDIANDLVVPRDGVYSANGCDALFPISDPLIYGPNDNIWHCTFFNNSRTMESILKHFKS